MKGLMKVFSDGSALLKCWEMIGLLKEYMWERVWVELSRLTTEEVV